MMSGNPWRAAVVLGAALAFPAAAQTVRVDFQNGLYPYPGYGGATDITITVQDDQDKQADQNYGSGQYLASDGFPARQASLMKFPLDGGALPSNAVIQGAELLLWVRNETYTGSSAYQVLRPWDEGQATYLQPMSGQSWAVEGASAVGVDRSGVPFVTFKQLDAGFLNILAVTDAGVDLVRKWRSGGTPNYGLILQDYDSWDKVAVDSSETINPPLLKVLYDAGLGTQSLVIAATDDTMITYQPENYEGWGLGVSGRPDGSTASLLRWDLRAIPRDAVVQDAELGVTVNRIAGDPAKAPFELYAARAPWNEKADWRTYDAVNPWAARGAQDQNLDHGPRLDFFPACPTQGALCASRVTGSLATIQDWIRDPAGNHGFLVQNYSTDQDLQLFDGEAPSPQSRPRLSVFVTFPPGRLPGLIPEYAEVYPGDQVQMTPFAGAAPYAYSVASISNGSIDQAGTYKAGNAGTDIVQVVDQGGAGNAGYATIVVLDKTNADGGGASPIGIALTPPPALVPPLGSFAVTADVHSRASFQVRGLSLVLSGRAVTVDAPTEVGGVRLPEDAGVFSLPDIDPNATLRLIITGTMRATPSDSPSVTASVSFGGTEVATATTPVPMDVPAPIDTGCGCRGGLGGASLALAMAAIMILQMRRARAASTAAQRSCDRRISPD